MKRKTITINENNVEGVNMRSLVFNVIDSVMRDHNLQSIKDWEKSEFESNREKSENMKTLMSLKEQLKELISLSSDNEDGKYDVKLSFELEIQEKESGKRINGTTVRNISQSMS